MTAPEFATCPDHGPEPLARMIAELREYHLRRQTYIRATTALTNSARAMCRNAVWTLWMEQARAIDLGKPKDRAALTATAQALYKAAERMVLQALTGKSLGPADILEGDAQPDALPSCGPDGRSLCDIQGGDAARPAGRKLSPEEHALVPAIADKIQPIIVARRAVELPTRDCQRRMERRAAALHVAPWAKAVNGFGLLSLGQIVAEAGDLDRYANPNKLWKMMELAVIDGQRQRRSSDKELALKMGYGGRRQAIMTVCAVNLIMLNGDGAYRRYYLERKERQAAIHPELPLIHREKRARRELAKRLLRDLWREWTGRGVEWADVVARYDDPERDAWDDAEPIAEPVEVARPLQRVGAAS